MTKAPQSPFDKSNYKPQESIEPESDSCGPIEYKRRLTNVTPERLERLTSQLKWRLTEGGGTSLYELGVSDDGKFIGLSPSELQDSLCCLNQMCREIRTHLRINRSITMGDDDRKVVEILVTQKDLKIPNSLRTILIGPSEAGKSTAIGNIVNNCLDDGAGKSRNSVLRHRHELVSGKTSCIAQEIWGYSKECTKIDYSLAGVNSWQQVVDASSDSIIHVLDTPGRRSFQQEKLKFFMKAWIPDLVIVVLTPGLEWREYLQLCRDCIDNVIIVINKADTGQFQNRIHVFLTQLMMFIHSWGENIASCRIIVSDEEAYILGKQNKTDLGKQHIIPIFITSLVTGDGLSLLNRYIYTRSTSSSSSSCISPLDSVISIDTPNIFCILSTFKNSTILAGVMHYGFINVDTCYKLRYLSSGPGGASSSSRKKKRLQGRVKECIVRVVSIQIFKITSQKLSFPQAGSLMIELCTTSNGNTSMKRDFDYLVANTGYFAWHKL